MKSKRLGPQFGAVAFLTLGTWGTVSLSSIQHVSFTLFETIFNAAELPECPDADSSRQDDFHGG
ncbi:hypothetical protein BPAE_0144g00040 [Botrytis paeoniae]|uniref:Uncharacterized protein n=1 Tax=Botrytis paeoniae TaxID=278948 RepID=A0A4Z1FDZ6_9HELO|nr:hypothetical protein BPAE_0144g00040 [Botrytis paeoniae]